MNGINQIVYEYGFALTQFILFLCFLTLGLYKKKFVFKQFLFMLSAIPFSVLLFELIGISQSEDPQVVFSGTFFNNHQATGTKKIYGYGPANDTVLTVTAIRKNKDSLIYNAKYSLKYGKRDVLNTNKNSNYCISFIGGSNIFGDGLNDNQTLPYLLNYVGENSYAIKNYAFSGYGTHQSYAAINSEFIPSLNTEDSNVLVYFFIPEHINRAAGKAAWDKYGPLYNIEEDSICHKGTFYDNLPHKSNPLLSRWIIMYRNSNVYKKIMSEFMSEKNIERVFFMLMSMYEKSMTHNFRFILLVNNYDTNKSKLETKLFHPLQRKGLEMYFVDSVIPDYSLNGVYTIHGDGHPNVMFNEKMAVFLNKILKADVPN